MNQIPSKIEALLHAGAIIPAPQMIFVAEDLDVAKIESGVTLLPGAVLQGAKTMLGKGTVLGPGGVFSNIRCGRNVKLASGSYHNSVFLDGVEVRGGAEIRGGCLLMEESRAAHTVGCKMSILGIKVTLGSLINYCDVLITGGTNQPFGFAEIGSGAIHYNFSPNGIKFGSLIGPGASGEMFGLFPRTFIGGQTQIIAPVTIGSQVLIPAGTAVRHSIKDGVLSVDTPLSPGEKSYQPEMITSVEEKFMITAHLITHYEALASFFQDVRKTFARACHDFFLETLYDEALAVIQANIHERIGWLFCKKEDGKRADLFARLPISEELHKQELRRAKGAKIVFSLNQIQEHQLVASQLEILCKKLQEPLIQTEGKTEFLELNSALLQKRFAFNGNVLQDKPCQANQDKPSPSNRNKSYQADYFDFISRWIPEDAGEQGKEWLEKGKNWLEKMVSSRMKEIGDILQNARNRTEIGLERNRWNSLISSYIPSLFQQCKLLFTGEWNASQMGMINQPGDIEIASWTLLSWIPISYRYRPEVVEEKLRSILERIKEIGYPVLIHWPSLTTIAFGQPEISTEILKQSCVRFHGTDGLRGTMSIPSDVPSDHISLVQTIQAFMLRQELTPEFMEALARNTVYAWEAFYKKELRIVAIGRDPRDLYKDDPKREQIFYKAIQKGVLSTGKHVSDFGIIPTPAVPYLMAWSNNPISKPSDEIELFLYKTASHNPASQDGLKVFIREVGNDGGLRYVKASKELEFAVSALLFQEAIGKPCLKKSDVYQRLYEIPRVVLSETMMANLPQIQSVPFMVADLANGAFSWPPYPESVSEAIKKSGVGQFALVGNHPNGNNINSNEGEDRVGANLMENVHTIKEAEIKPGGRFYGLPSLKALFEFGDTHRSELMENGTAWSIYTDGDGDRSYAVFYDPFQKVAQVIDGDKGFYYQMVSACSAGKIKPGTKIAFTVDSSVPFINAVIRYLKCFGDVHFVFSNSAEIPPDKIGILITPVGDKYLLHSQCLAAEASGHFVRPYNVRVYDKKTEHTIFAANGFMSCLYTVSAMTETLNSIEGTFEEKLKRLAFPYPNPHNSNIHVYFISKKFWYRNSSLWKQVSEIVIQIWKDFCNDNPAQELKEFSYEEEPDMMYYVCFSTDGSVLFTILGRPSGTENKFSLKFMGTEETKPFFLKLTDSLYVRLADAMKDRDSKAYKDERIILKYLAQQKSSVPLETIKNLVLKEPNDPVERAQLMTILDAISEKGQKLVEYNGSELKITARGLLLV